MEFVKSYLLLFDLLFINKNILKASTKLKRRSWKGLDTFSSKVNKKKNSAGIFKQSLGARNREGIGLSYRPARLNSLME
jgi:hypothetical protein